MNEHALRGFGLCIEMCMWERNEGRTKASVRIKEARVTTRRRQVKRNLLATSCSMFWSLSFISTKCHAPLCAKHIVIKARRLDVCLPRSLTPLFANSDDDDGGEVALVLYQPRDRGPSQGPSRRKDTQHGSILLEVPAHTHTHVHTHRHT